MKFVERINNVFIWVDEIVYMEELDRYIDFFLLIVVDCEVGFGGLLNVFEFIKVMVKVVFY